MFHHGILNLAYEICFYEKFAKLFFLHFLLFALAFIFRTFNDMELFFVVLSLGSHFNSYNEPVFPVFIYYMITSFFNLPYLKKNKNIHLKGLKGERGRDPPPTSSIPNDRHARNLEFHLVFLCGFQAQALRAPSTAFPDTLAWTWIQNGTTGIWTGAYMGH